MTVTTTTMTITIEDNGCPTLTATKGNTSIIYDGMNFLLYKAIIKHDDRIEEVTDYDTVVELERELFTEEDNEEIVNAIKEYCGEYY